MFLYYDIVYSCCDFCFFMLVAPKYLVNNLKKIAAKTQHTGSINQNNLKASHSAASIMISVATSMPTSTHQRSQSGLFLQKRRKRRPSSSRALSFRTARRRAFRFL